MRSIRALAREAYQNRYAFDRVTVHTDGAITGHWEGRAGRVHPDPLALGHIDDCRTVRTSTGTRFYNRHMLVFTFAPGA
jgi:hypothetical protein